MNKQNFRKICDPAKLYLAISTLGLIYGLIQQYSIITLGTNFIFIIIWTMVLNFICSIGLKQLSWILVLLPYLMLFLSVGIVQNIYMKEKFQSQLANTQAGANIRQGASAVGPDNAGGYNDIGKMFQSGAVNNPGNQNSALAKRCNSKQFARVNYCNWNNGSCKNNGAQRPMGMSADFCTSVK